MQEALTLSFLPSVNLEARPLVLQERDFDILRILNKVPYLSLKQICAAFFPHSAETGKKRVSELRKHEYLKLVFEDKHIGNIYSLGARALSNFDGLRRIRLNPMTLTHDLQMNWIYILITSLVQIRNIKTEYDFRLEGFERDAFPDLTLNHPRFKVGIEIERSAKNMERYKKHFDNALKSYSALFYLYPVEQKRIFNILKLFQNSHKEMEDKIFICTLEDFCCNPIDAEFESKNKVLNLGNVYETFFKNFAPPPRGRDEGRHEGRVKNENANKFQEDIGVYERIAQRLRRADLPPSTS